MKAYTISTINSDMGKPRNQYINHSKGWDNITFLLIVGVLLQGIFYLAIYPLVSQRSEAIFRLLPFNLFPSEFLFTPIAFFVAFLAGILKTPRRSSKQGKLLVAYWIVCFIGLMVGLTGQNARWATDFKDLALRTILAPLFYLIGLRVNFEKVFQKIIFFSVLLALLEISQAVGMYTRIPVPSYGSSLFGGQSLLLPYSLLLVRTLSGKSSSIFWERLALIILALGIVTPLWKPVVALFIICTVMGFVLSRRLVNSRQKKIKTLMSLLMLLIAVGSVIWLVFFATGTGVAQEHILITYFKYYSANPDLSSNRFTIWKIGINTWMESPLLGKGFGYALNGFLPWGNGYKYFDNIYTHNIIIKILVLMGILGLISLLVVFFVWLNSSLKTINNLVKTYCADIQAGLLTFCLTMLAGSLYGELVNGATAGYLFWACVGLQAAIISRQLSVPLDHLGAIGY